MESAAKFDPEARYVTSYLLSPIVLGFIRLLLGKYTIVTNLVILIWTAVSPGGANTFFSFFTHLSYIGLTAWFWAAGVQSLAYAKSCMTKDTPKYPLQSWSRVFQILHEMLYATIVTFPLLTTIVYWALLASSDSFAGSYKAWSNISQHVLNSLFVLFELFCTNLPTLHWIGLPVTVVLLGLYLGVAYIAHATQGIYPYAFLDPGKQGALLAAYIVGIAVGQTIVFIIVRYAIILRIHLVGKRNVPELHANHDQFDKNEKEI